MARVAPSSRYKPLVTSEAWSKIIDASTNLKILGSLSDGEAQRVFEAVEILEMVQNSWKHKRYKRFLHDVLRNAGPQAVLLCAVALGQVRIVDMKNKERVGLVEEIKRNKDHGDVNDRVLESLAHSYHIPKSVNDLPPPIHAVVERPRKRKRTAVEPPPQAIHEQPLLTGISSSQTSIPYEPQNPGQENPPELLTGDVYELTLEDVQLIVALSDQISGKIWLTDTYENTTPFVTIPISHELTNRFTTRRPRVM